MPSVHYADATLAFSVCSPSRLCTKSPCSGISLCNLCVLCVSVVWFYSEFINHRDTEDTEVAQRRARSRLFVQSPEQITVRLKATLSGEARARWEQQNWQLNRPYSAPLVFSPNDKALFLTSSKDQKTALLWELVTK